MRALTVQQPWAIIGVVDLVTIHHDSDHGRIHRCSSWAQPDQWHLQLAAPRPFPEPIPCKGRLGLWAPTQDVLDAIALATVRDGETA